MSRESTQFKPGNKGRKPGAVNRSTRIVKQVIADVFDKMQDDPEANLLTWAKANPTEFYKLAAKLIPLQLAGDPESPVSVNLEGLTFEQLYQLKYGAAGSA